MQMRKIYKKGCYFYRSYNDNLAKCAINKFTCLLCDYYIVPIEKLDIKDYIALVYNKRSINLALLLSIVSVIVSIIIIILKIY